MAVLTCILLCASRYRHYIDCIGVRGSDVSNVIGERYSDVVTAVIITAWWLLHCLADDIGVTVALLLFASNLPCSLNPTTLLRYWCVVVVVDWVVRCIDCCCWRYFVMTIGDVDGDCVVLFIVPWWRDGDTFGIAWLRCCWWYVVAVVDCCCWFYICLVLLWCCVVVVVTWCRCLVHCCWTLIPVTRWILVGTVTVGFFFAHFQLNYAIDDIVGRYSVFVVVVAHCWHCSDWWWLLNCSAICWWQYSIDQLLIHYWYLLQTKLTFIMMCILFHWWYHWCAVLFARRYCICITINILCIVWSCSVLCVLPLLYVTGLLTCYAWRRLLALKPDLMKLICV